MREHEFEQPLIYEKPVLPALKIKLSQEYDLSFLSPEQREKSQEDAYHRQKMFNNIMRLKKLLLHVFPSHSWKFSDSGTKLTFINKNNAQEAVTIYKRKNEIKFTGPSIPKLIEASSRFDQETDVDLYYEIEALSLTDALSYMKVLHEHHFDVSKVSRYDLKSKEPFDVNSHVTMIMKGETKESKAKPKPKGKAKKGP